MKEIKRTVKTRSSGAYVRKSASRIGKSKKERTAKTEVPDYGFIPEKNFKLLLESTHDIIWTVDAEGRFTYISPKIERILGFTPLELLRKSHLELMSKPESAGLSDKFASILKKKKVFRKLQNYMLNKKGKPVYFETSGSPVYDSGGNFKGFHCFSHDVTEKVLAERELKKNERLWSTLIKTSPDGISISSLDGNIQYASDKAVKMFGYRKMQEVAGKNIKVFIDVKFRGKAKEQLSGIIKGNYIGFSDYLLVRKDGSKFWCEVNAEILRDENGMPMNFFFIQRDISAKKKIEDELRASESTLSKTIEFSPIGLAILSPDGKWLKVNRSLCNILGYNEKELLSGTFMDISHPDDLSRDLGKMKKLLKGSIDSYITEKRYIGKKGNVITVQLNVTPVRHDNGKIKFFIAQIQDITGKKLSESAIIESEKKHRALFENMTQGVIYQDSQGRIISANPSAVKILGISYENMKGRKSNGKGWKTIREDGTVMPVSEHPAIKSLKTGKQSNAVIGIYNPEIAKYIWVNVISVPQFKSGESKPYQVITTIEDISVQIENKKLQDKLSSKIKDYTVHLEQEVKSRTAEIESLMSFNSAIIDNADIAIVSTDRKGTIVTFNHAAEKMLGYKAKEVKGKMSVMKLYDQKTIDASLAGLGYKYKSRKDFNYEKYMRKVIEKRSDNFEWFLRSKDGKNIPVLLSLKMLKDSRNETIGYVGVGVDISRRIGAEKALLESEERFQKMFHEHDAIMLLVDPVNGDIVEANKSASRFYGYDFTRKGKYKISDLNILSLRQINKQMGRASSQKYNCFVFPHKLASGEIKTVEVHSSPIQINNRKLLFSVIHDVTERKQAEEALKKSENENRAIVRAVPDMLFKIHRDGTYLETYTTDQSAFYVPPEQFLGKRIDEVLPEFHAALALGSLYKAFFTSDIVSYEYELPIKGVNRYFENRVIAISDTEALSIIRDITERKKIEAALHESESKYRNLHESMMDGYVMIELDGTILEFNESYRKLTGYSESELKNMNFRNLTPPKWYEMEDKIIKEQIIKRGYSDIYEKEYIRKDGSICNVELHAFLLKNKSGGKDRSWAIVRDITERKKIEAALKLQSEAFESFINPVVITDIDANIQWVNPAFVRLTGYAKDEVIGRNTRILKSGVHDDIFYKNLWDTVLSGRYWSGEMINKRKDGSLYYEENTITPVKDLSGNIVNFIAVKSDITQKKEMEKALKLSDERWQFALEGSGDGVWDWNTETDKIYVSPQWKKTLGYGDDEPGNDMKDITALIHPEDYQNLISKLNDYSRTKSDVLMNEHRMLCKDGTYKWVLIRGKGVEKNGKGEYARVIGTQSDISKRKEFEEQLLRNLEKEKELNELKSRFISMASHEFRTPLASILLISDVLGSYWDKFSREQINSKLGNIKERVMHLTEIVNDVLHLSKIQGGKIEYSPEIVELVGECRKSVDGFNEDATLVNKIEFSSDVRKLYINIDLRLINQILNNLISNAVKYSRDNPGIRVRITDSGSEILLSVSDNGIGIPENDKKYIFDAFYRASNAKLIQGNGLGLNIIKESLISRGGDITFTSKTGEGTAFFVHLPKNVFANQK